VPEQATFFEEQLGMKRIVVLKTYDERFAREAFKQMTPEAMAFLGKSLEIESTYDQKELPSPSDADFSDALWQEVQDSAREDWNSFSYFVVKEESPGCTLQLYVSPDWPSAEAFAKERLLALAKD
jgi:hypothetical protein